MKTLVIAVLLFSFTLAQAQITQTIVHETGGNTDTYQLSDLDSIVYDSLNVNMIIHEIGGNTVSYPIANVDSITYDTTAIATYPSGTVHCNGTATAIVDVTSPTGKTWMDRNLGATQVASSSTDTASYGDLYQWGRGSDGHQCRTSGTTATLSSIDQPTHGDFIFAPGSPFDWRSGQNVNLWQGVGGTNNPCPSGYRLPTEGEFNAEIATWANNNAAGALASPLKLPMVGGRYYSNGLLSNVGTYGYYWSSTVSSTSSRSLFFYCTGASMGANYRASGLAVRCLKD